MVVPTQVEKMRTDLANLNNCAVPFLSRAAVNFSWYDHISVYTVYLYSVYNVYPYISIFLTFSLSL